MTKCEFLEVPITHYGGNGFVGQVLCAELLRHLIGMRHEESMKCVLILGTGSISRLFSFKARHIWYWRHAIMRYTYLCV